MSTAAEGRNNHMLTGCDHWRRLRVCMSAGKEQQHARESARESGAKRERRQSNSVYSTVVGLPEMSAEEWMVVVDGRLQAQEPPRVLQQFPEGPLPQQGEGREGRWQDLRLLPRVRWLLQEWLRRPAQVPQDGQNIQTKNSKNLLKHTPKYMATIRPNKIQTIYKKERTIHTNMQNNIQLHKQQIYDTYACLEC